MPHITLSFNWVTTDIRHFGLAICTFHLGFSLVDQHLWNDRFKSMNLDGDQWSSGYCHCRGCSRQSQLILISRISDYQPPSSRRLGFT